MHFAQHQRLDGIEFSVRRQVEILRGVLVDLKQAANFPPEVRGALLGFFPHLFYVPSQRLCRRHERQVTLPVSGKAEVYQGERKILFLSFNRRESLRVENKNSRRDGRLVEGLLGCLSADSLVARNDF